MRDTRAHLEEALEMLAAPTIKEFKELCAQGLDYRVELGLHVMELVDPALRPIDGWTLFGGYPFGRAKGLLDDTRYRVLRAARHHLASMHRREVWRSTLEAYLKLSERFREFSFAPDLTRPAVRLNPAKAPGRAAVYTHLISSMPPFTRSGLRPAQAGPHRFKGQSFGWEDVVIPADLPVVAPPAMRLEPVPGRSAFDEPVAALRTTARQMAWLDSEKNGAGSSKILDDWETRFIRMQLSTIGGPDDERFHDADRLVIDRLLNLIGIPGVGKSTLRDIIAVHAVTVLDQRAVLVVGDVADALKVAERFNRLREKAAHVDLEKNPEYASWSKLRAVPIVGTSQRDKHITRLHRRVNGRWPNPLLHDDAGFEYFSTACALSALRGAEAERALRFREAPCSSLIPLKPADEGEDPPLEEERKRRSCPLWASCARHHAARSLPDATVWIATPEALVVSSLPAQQNLERVRYLEAACLNSNLIIVDEADQVQIRLDRVFAPAASLYKRGDDSWLDGIARHSLAVLAREGRIQLEDTYVRLWMGALDMVATTANRIYAMLVEDESLREWVGSDLFSVWSLQLSLVSRWPATRLQRDVSSQSRLLGWLDQDPKQQQVIRDKRREVMLKILDDFRDDPVGDADEAELANVTPAAETLRLSELARRLVTNSPGNPRARREVADLLASLAGFRDPDTLVEDPENSLDAVTLENVRQELELERRRFEFTILLAIMHDRLNLITSLWPRIETSLSLDPSANALYHSSPADFAAVIPESPMGDILAFQFVPDGHRGFSNTGELRFIRYTGLGRRLLKALPTLHAVDDSHGPNVLLMSGTSWAGASTRYHLEEPVTAVLHATPGQAGQPSPLPKIFMETTFIYDRVEGADSDTPKRPLYFSGAGDDIRTDILRKMVRGLTEPDPGHDWGLSKFQAEINKLPIGRGRLLVLTGSYRDAAVAAVTINESKNWKDEVCLLISDDYDPMVDGALFDLDPNKAVPTLRRGEVASFAGTGHKILVAPLLSVERGHNILNDQDKAGFGAVYFLSRPFPQPGNIDVLVHALNDYTTRQICSGGEFETRVGKAPTLDKAGLDWRKTARGELHRLANRRMSWRGLSAADREYLTWDLMVTLWQVIGRLTRGGVDARVHFVDAAFAPKRAEGTRGDRASTSLLVSMRDVLAPYFGNPTWQKKIPAHRLEVDAASRYLAEALYRPLYDGLKALLDSEPAPIPDHRGEVF
ncbi:pPIWI_RE_Z domain-containing protein [Actinoallomurus acaciae]|uniref:pPIWI-RE three-gene island domain-containing protein n=1 Tax=Actinoallomurus acaciae TaxID=502577 RepID=A0ABV5YBB0_9ACTN